MANEWGNNSLAAGKSAGWYFVRDNRTGFLPVLQVMPLTPSNVDGKWALTSGGYPYFNQLGISTIWSKLTDDLQNLVYEMVVQNNSNETIEYAFLEADLYAPYNPVPAPGGGLKSNSNYFLYNCENILGLTVTINVTEEIVGSDGFGFQVNAYSAKGDFDGAQQYVITMNPDGELYAAVDNWENGSTQLINHFEPMASFSGGKLPAGYTLTIALQSDANERITAATYTAVDQQGHTAGEVTLDLLSLGLVGGGAITDADLAPIVAFQLDFVDWANGNSTTLSSGAGEITYAATSQLTVGSTEPGCVDWSYGTVESSNSIYSQMGAGPGTAMTQSFAWAGASEQIRRAGAVAHKLIPPASRR